MNFKPAKPVISGPVLIAGGGPVGLSAALELARLGVRSLVLEPRTTIAPHPKTRVLNTRTLEIMRGWGHEVQARMRGIDSPDEWKSPVRLMDSLAGRQLFELPTHGVLGPGSDVSPSSPVLSSQERFEQILFDAAYSHPLISIATGQQVVKLLHGDLPGDTTAAVEVRDVTTGETTAHIGPALIGADGADSFVRAALAIERDGEEGVGYFVNCHFRADLEARLAHIPAHFYLVAGAVTGAFQPLDTAGRWLCQISVSKEQCDLSVYTAERASEWIAKASGFTNLDIDVQAITRWRMNALVAREFQRGRVLLCGDAAHQFPPTGGLGVNTGIQGVHNAMWKLAMVLRGSAGASLLNTYQVERQEPTRWTVKQSLMNYYAALDLGDAFRGNTATAPRVDNPATVIRRWGNQVGAELGICYNSSAMVSDGTTAPIPDDPYSEYQPSATPGCRAPHMWLGSPRAPLSTLDLIGAEFTLLAAPGGSAWIQAAEASQQHTGVRLARYRIGSPGLMENGCSFTDLYGVDSDGAVLVRPDGYVAWRSVGSKPHAETELADVVSAILGHDSAGASTSNTV